MPSNYVLCFLQRLFWSPHSSVCHKRAKISLAISILLLLYQLREQGYSLCQAAARRPPVGGVRCRFAPEDLKIGERIRVGIDQSVRVHDKLLLILSEHSLASDTALQQERQRKETVLFPVRLDEAVMQSQEGWAAHIKRTRNIGDFCKWRGRKSYQKAFQRLLRELKVKAS
jgi:hypothetical protein